MIMTVYILHAVVGVVLYLLFFRSGIYDRLRYQKNSKTFIKKHKHGPRNYWFYTEINELAPLGIWYYLNIVYLFYSLSFLVATVVTIAIGALDVMRPIMLFLSVILFLIEVPTMIFYSVYSCLCEYDRPFVLFERRKGESGYFSSLKDICLIFVPMLFVVIMFLDYFLIA